MSKSDLSSVPTKQHYAIITQEQHYSYDGYGDSRHQQNAESYIGYTAYDNKDEWEAHIKRLTQTHKSFRAIVASPATVTTTITIDTKF